MCSSLAAAAFLGFSWMRRPREVRAPDRSNRSHLGPRPRPLVGRARQGSGAQHPTWRGGAKQPAAAPTFPPPGNQQQKSNLGQLSFLHLFCPLPRKLREPRACPNWEVALQLSKVENGRQLKAGSHQQSIPPPPCRHPAH